MLQVIATVFGIGFLLFIHELGHYVAARLAGVRVEVFSLGFGPRIFGWQRNGTDFRLAWIPIGGYVRLAGEDQVGEPKPDELGAKSVGWRFLIFSGGILMNFLFAIVTFPILFAIGIPFVAPVAGEVEPGSPAWEAGIQQGDRVLAANGQDVFAYNQIASAVALSPGDEPMRLEVLAGGEGAPTEIEVQPRYDEALGFRRLGVSAAWDPQRRVEVADGSPAAEAGLRSGDAVVEMLGVPVESPAALRAVFREATRESRPIPLVVLRDGVERSLTVVPELDEENAVSQLGIAPLQNVVREVRGGLAGVLEPGDELLQAGSRPVGSVNDLYLAAFEAGGLPALRILREGRALEIAADPALSPHALHHDVWIAAAEPGAELGMRIRVTPGKPAERAGLRDGDRLIQAGGQPLDSPSSPLQQLITRVQAAGEEPLALVYLRGDDAEPHEVRVAPEDSPVPVYGFGPRGYQEIVRSGNLVQSIRMGLSEARDMAFDVFRTIRRIFTGDVAARNLGGIITIGELTHNFAGLGLIPLLFFLSLISINLGVVNLLPVPALDGGHLALLLIEKVRGKPLGERAQVWFNMVGFAAVLSLVIFVTMNDLRRVLG